MSYDATRLRRTFWKILWGDSSAYDMGLMQDVDVNLSVKLDPITTGTTGMHVIGHRIVALDGQIVASAVECDLTTIQKMIPWYSSGSIPLLPAAANVDLYSYAQLLNLHPTDIAAATHTQDLNLIKATPLWAYKVKRDGRKDEVWQIPFMIYPNRTKLLATPQVIEYGYVGDAP